MSATRQPECHDCPWKHDADEYAVLRQSFEVREAAFHIDPRLPGILEMIGHGMTQAEVAKKLRVKQPLISVLIMKIRQKMNPDKA